MDEVGVGVDDEEEGDERDRRRDEWIVDCVSSINNRHLECSQRDRRR